VVAPWLLARTDPAIRACQKRPTGARCGTFAPEPRVSSGPCRPRIPGPWLPSELRSPRFLALPGQRSPQGRRSRTMQGVVAGTGWTRGGELGAACEIPVRQVPLSARRLA
jgi:hypothetical protein